jgi:hypothetical protein
MKTIFLTIILLVFSNISNAQVTTVNVTLANPCTALNLLEIPRIIDFTIYPNPTNEIVNIQLSGNLVESPKIKIYDVIGKLVYEKNNFDNYATQKLSFRVDYLTTGIYLISLQTNDKITTKKLIINK